MGEDGTPLTLETTETTDPLAPFFTDTQLEFGSLGEHGLPAPDQTQDGHRMIKITKQGNAVKYTTEQVKTNMTIMAERLDKPAGDIIVHGRPTGP